MGGRLTRRLEDYLRAIYELELDGYRVRMKNLADRMGVRLPTVFSAVCKLVEMGLVKHERRGHVTLTERGRALASTLLDKHVIIKSFLVRVLGLSEGKARRVACQIEHFLDDEVVASMALFLTKDSVE